LSVPCSGEFWLIVETEKLTTLLYFMASGRGEGKEKGIAARCELRSDAKITYSNGQVA
jgi:hypothetical protein